MRNPDRELDGTNTEDFPTGEAGHVWGSMDSDAPSYRLDYPDIPPRRIANVRRTADALRAFLRFLGWLTFALGAVFALLWGLA